MRTISGNDRKNEKYSSFAPYISLSSKDQQHLHFMPESVASGYNDNWWEIEKRRLAKLQPDVVRVGFQIDWMEPPDPSALLTDQGFSFFDKIRVVPVVDPLIMDT